MTLHVYVDLYGQHDIIETGLKDVKKLLCSVINSSKHSRVRFIVVFLSPRGNTGSLRTTVKMQVSHSFQFLPSCHKKV
jgi:hypothetical protein